MKDPAITSLVNDLHLAVGNVNDIMARLQSLNVEVRISYIDPKDRPAYDSNQYTQGIKLWRVEERNDYL